MAAKKTEEEAEDYRVMEITIICAQDLKGPATSLGKFDTYAVVWVGDKARKVRTRTTSSGAGGNPTWNDKFRFCVSGEFFTRCTAGLDVEIYAVGSFRDTLIGTARCLLSQCVGKFAAVYVHRPKEDFRGILNLAAAYCGRAERLRAVPETGSSALNRASSLLSFSFRNLSRESSAKKYIKFEKARPPGIVLPSRIT